MNEMSVEPEAISAPPPVESRRAAPLFDESVSADGALRPHYAKFFGSLEKIGAAERERRWENSRRLVQEQGIAYNVYGDARGMERPWEIDPVPLLIAPDEWRALEAGLIQRADLINRILADCYGPQNLIRTGGLPPALVFGQPAFLRACHGIAPQQGKFLVFYAADVARSQTAREILAVVAALGTAVAWWTARRALTRRTARLCAWARMA